jgi:chromosome partitioning protein
VIDTPAGLHGRRFKDVMKIANKVLVPLQPSIFDMYATRTFLEELQQMAQGTDLQIGIVGTRVDARTIAAGKLAEFVSGLGLPMVGYVRDTQNYIHLTAQGLTVFDVAPVRVERDLELWKPICQWLDRR